MAPDRWPGVGPEKLRELWRRYGAQFAHSVRLEEVERHVSNLREAFLMWLEDNVGQLEAGTPKARGRVRLGRVEVSIAGDSGEATIEMTSSGQTVTGHRKDHVDMLSITCVQATIDALANFYPNFSFKPERALFVPLEGPGTEDVLTIVTVREGNVATEMYVGGCASSSYNYAGFAKATLDAINRIVTPRGNN